MITIARVCRARGTDFVGIKDNAYPLRIFGGIVILWAGIQALSLPVFL
jgi:hypothetical protein